MSRIARRVPPDWTHPKDNETGRYISLSGNNFEKAATRWDLDVKKWEEGLVSNFNEGWVPIPAEHAAKTHIEYFGERPKESSYLPNWSSEQKTHYQMYSLTGDIPISPVMDSPEVLAKWLAYNNATLFADEIGTYEKWLNISKAAQ